MKVKVTHNYDEIAKMFKSLGAKVQRNVLSEIGSSYFGEKVQEIVEQEIDKLGFGARATFLKKSFKILSTEVTTSGLVYRITSDSSQATRLNEGAPPSSLYTLGTKMIGNGIYSGVEPTGFMEKIEQRAKDLVYEKVQAIIASTLKSEGL